MYKYIGLADLSQQAKGEWGRQLILLEFAQNLTDAVSVRIGQAINIDNFSRRRRTKRAKSISRGLNTANQ